MTFYQVQATITRTVDGATSTRQVPTFYLDSRVQGILSVEHATRVAGDVISTIVGPVTMGQAVGWETAVTEVVDTPADRLADAATQALPFFRGALRKSHALREAIAEYRP